MKGIIFSIKRYAIHDGPGIRVTFFMKGCPLDCWWCHNPEGKSSSRQSVERIDRIGEREFRTMEQVGKEYTPSEVLAKAEQDRVFMEHSGGGVTFSGGEPLHQPEFLLASLRELDKAGFHTAVDTCGYASQETFMQIMPYTDLFLFDIKHLDPGLHKKYTGVDNDLIISNFDFLMQQGAGVIVRVPVVPGITATTSFMEDLRFFLESRNTKRIREINLLPYHKTGRSKYRRFELDDRMSGIDQVRDSHLDDFIEILKPLGISIKKGG